MRFNRFTFISTLLVMLVFTGCTTLDPYTGEKQTAKATRGAIIGAVAGAAAGVLTGDNADERRKRALIGAGVGAIAGGAVGNYMDNQEAALREELANTGVSVTRVGDELLLNMPGNVTFDTGRADIQAGFYDVLNSVVKVLNEYEATLIDVVGHTDSTGSDAINQPLSERRAASVAQYLESQGIKTVRIAHLGQGSRAPIADNSTEQGRSLNRRVELALVPITQ